MIMLGAILLLGSPSGAILNFRQFWGGATRLQTMVGQWAEIDDTSRRVHCSGETEGRKER